MFVLSRQVPFLSLLVFSQVVLVYFLVLYFNKTLQWAMQYHFGSFIMFSFHFHAEVTEIATVLTLFEPLHLNITSGYFASFLFIFFGSKCDRKKLIIALAIEYGLT